MQLALFNRDKPLEVTKCDLKSSMGGIQLRDYQQAAVDAVFDLWNEPKCRPLVVLPTGAGKSLVVAAIAKRALEERPRERVMPIVHSLELVSQNYMQTRNLWQQAPAGIYCASLNRKDVHAKMIFASIQSAARAADRFRNVGTIIIDEVHLLNPANDDTSYRKLIATLSEQNPALRIMGMTATPWRLSSGNLTEPYKGNPPFFTDIAYEMTISELMAAGHLSPLTAKATRRQLSVENVRTRNGEFKEDDLNAAVNTDPLNEGIVEETIAAGADRKGWLVFAVSIDHAERLAKAFVEKGVAAACISSHTDKATRARLIAEYKAGRLRCLTNCGVLTTGFDAPHTDLIALARPTMSPGLYLQMLGRAMRKAAGKADGLVLDFAGNVRRHGLVDMVKGVSKSNEVKTKECAECGTHNAIENIVCTGCGAAFPVKEKREGAAAPTAAMREQQLNLDTPDKVASGADEVVWLDVEACYFARHSKPGKPDSLRLEFRVPGERFPIPMWLCLSHEGYAQKQAALAWRRLAKSTPPTSTEEGLGRVNELQRPKRVLVKRDGAFTKVVAFA